MIHRKPPWPTPAQLRDIIVAQLARGGRSSVYGGTTRARA
jgi:hypothetical protein